MIEITIVFKWKQFESEVSILFIYQREYRLICHSAKLSFSFAFHSKVINGNAVSSLLALLAGQKWNNFEHMKMDKLCFWMDNFSIEYERHRLA